MIDFEFVDGTTLSSVIEALIFAAPQAVTINDILKTITEIEPNLTINKAEIESCIVSLNNRYEDNGLSFSIRRHGKGYAFITKERYHPWLKHYQHMNENRKLSQSAIEALAIIAYKQPITKPEIDDIRGVDSGYIVRSLLEKKLIDVAGRKDVPGKPLLYRTSHDFLEHFGINSVSELPRPREIEDILKDEDMQEHRQIIEEYGGVEVLKPTPDEDPEE